MTWWLTALVVIGAVIAMLCISGAVFVVLLLIGRSHPPDRTRCCAGCGEPGWWPHRGPSGYPLCDHCAPRLAMDPRE